jgi:hypothetical protein
MGARKRLALSDSDSRKRNEPDINAFAMWKMLTDTNPDLTWTDRSRSTPRDFGPR